MIDKKLIHSAHDVSEGGLFVTLMESCFNRNLGMNVVQSQKEIRSDAFWFGESQSRVVVTVSKENRNDFILLLEKLETVVTYLGTVTSGTIVVNSEDWGAVSDWKNAYDNAIAELLAGHESEHALSSL